MRRHSASALGERGAARTDVDGDPDEVARGAPALGGAQLGAERPRRVAEARGAADASRHVAGSTMSACTTASATYQSINGRPLRVPVASEVLIS